MDSQLDPDNIQFEDTPHHDNSPQQAEPGFNFSQEFDDDLESEEGQIGNVNTKKEDDAVAAPEKVEEPPSQVEESLTINEKSQAALLKGQSADEEFIRSDDVTKQQTPAFDQKEHFAPDSAKETPMEPTSDSKMLHEVSHESHSNDTSDSSESEAEEPTNKASQFAKIASAGEKEISEETAQGMNPDVKNNLKIPNFNQFQQEEESKQEKYKSQEQAELDPDLCHFCQIDFENTKKGPNSLLQKCDFETKFFKGCQRTYCRKHGVVPLEKYKELILTPGIQRELESNKKKLNETHKVQNYADLDVNTVHFCHSCEDAFGESLIARAAQKKKLVTYAALAIILVAIAFIASKVLGGGEVVESKCGPGETYISSLDTCFSAGFNSAENSECPEYTYFNELKQQCMTRDCEISQVLNKTGDCVDTLYQLINEDGMCPLHSHFEASIGKCAQRDCGRGHTIRENGECKKCPSYSYPDPTKTYCIQQDECEPVNQFTSVDGRCLPCNEMNRFEDAKGQLQCIGTFMTTRMIAFRLCEPSKRLWAQAFNCLTCPRGSMQRYDYDDTQECISEEPQSQEIILNNGFPQRCEVGKVPDKNHEVCEGEGKESAAVEVSKATSPYTRVQPIAMVNAENPYTRAGPKP